MRQGRYWGLGSVHLFQQHSRGVQGSKGSKGSKGLMTTEYY